SSSARGRRPRSPRALPCSPTRCRRRSGASSDRAVTGAAAASSRVLHSRSRGDLVMQADSLRRIDRRTAVQQGAARSSRRGIAILVLLCLVQFMDILDAAIVNVALPSIRRDLGFSQQSLQWVVSGYIVMYGGFLLLGSRAADLLGRRRVLVTGLIVFGGSSLAGGVDTHAGVLIDSRLWQR